MTGTNKRHRGQAIYRPYRRTKRDPFRPYRSGRRVRLTGRILITRRPVRPDCPRVPRTRRPGPQRFHHRHHLFNRKRVHHTHHRCTGNTKVIQDRVRQRRNASTNRLMMRHHKRLLSGLIVSHKFGTNNRRRQITLIRTFRGLRGLIGNFTKTPGRLQGTNSRNTIVVSLNGLLGKFGL